LTGEIRKRDSGQQQANRKNRVVDHEPPKQASPGVAMLAPAVRALPFGGHRSNFRQRY